MGKGDKKTRRGKLFSGSFGVKRSKRKSKPIIAAKKPAAKPSKPKVEKAEPVAEVMAPVEQPVNKPTKSTKKEPAAKAQKEKAPEE